MFPTIDWIFLKGCNSARTPGRLVGVRSGRIRYFDSRDEKIGLDHVLGSSAVPPTFPAVRIDGEAYWDGGIYSNPPVEVVFDDYPRRSCVVFAVQIWHTRGEEPESVAEVFARQKDIMFGSRSTACGTSSARWSTCSPRRSETPARSRSSPSVTRQHSPFRQTSVPGWDNGRDYDGTEITRRSR
jgi:predicted acylesterase/phospholipase RssA